MLSKPFCPGSFLSINNGFLLVQLVSAPIDQLKKPNVIYFHHI